jgi:hypothetical protein
MSYNGSGTFNINSTGQPVVAGTVITASAFNALTADLATGLTTAITKDGQTTTTARITFAQGVTSSLVTDSSSTSTGSIITAGGVGIAKALYVGTTATVSQITSASATALTLQSAGTTAITVDTSQNVGIGTTSPATKLEIIVNGGAVSGSTVSNTTGSEIGLSHSTGAGPSTYSLAFRTTGSALNGISGSAFASQVISSTTSSNALEMYTTGATPLVFGTNATERMRIDSSGNLLVGKTTNSDTTGAGVLIRPTGYVTATRAESTNADDTFHVYSTGASAYRFYVGMAGTIFATSIVITAISDQRLKENVREIDTGLDSIMALKPRRFDWKEGKGQDKKNVAGFIAQEFETVFPECVSTSKAGGDGVEYKNINHETLIPTLVKAIQELKAINDTQAETINALTARIVALENA